VQRGDVPVPDKRVVLGGLELLVLFGVGEEVRAQGGVFVGVPGARDEAVGFVEVEFVASLCLCGGVGGELVGFGEESVAVPGVVGG